MKTARSRRSFLAGAAAAGATIVLPRVLSATPDGKKTFTILHTNDMHSNFIGMGPASDYTPFTLNDDTTRGGYARLASLIAKRKEARKEQGPVLDWGCRSVRHHLLEPAVTASITRSRLKLPGFWRGGNSRKLWSHCPT